MFCRTCGSQIPDGYNFCDKCGTLVSQGAAEVPAAEPVSVAPAAEPAPGTAPPPPPVPPKAPAPVPPPASAPSPGPGGTQAGYAPPGGSRRAGGPGSPGRGGRRDLWLGIAVAAVIVVAAAVAVPLLVLHEAHRGTGTTEVVSTTSTTGPTTSTSSTASSSTSTSTTTAGTSAPGDSAGEWVQADLPPTPAGAISVCVSEQAVLFETRTPAGFELYVHMLGSSGWVQLPAGGTADPQPDLDGSLAVWREGTYDSDTGQYSDEHIYAYLLPDGPKVEVAAGGGSFGYPQVAGSRVTWVIGGPWDEDPDHYALKHIYGVKVDAAGRPTGEPVELVSAATADAVGDSLWFYSLSATHLAWEEAAAVNVFDIGTYAMDLGTLQPVKVGDVVWQPSLGGNRVVYWSGADGVMVASLPGGQPRQIDPSGQFATAGPTFAAYFRTVESGDKVNYDIVARGYTGGYEQVLAEQYLEPYMAPAIAVSATHVAFVRDDMVYLYEWQGR